MNSNRRFCKSAEDKAIFGVCGGIGEYFDIDSLIVRLIFVILFMAYGSGLGVYLLLALVMPKKSPEMRYAYSGAPGETYYGTSQEPENPARAAAMEFSAQMTGAEKEENTPWPQASDAPAVPAAEEAQEAMAVMEAMEEPAEDDLDPAPVINAKPEAPKAAAAAQVRKSQPETERYDKFAAYSSINQNGRAGEPGRPGRNSGKAAGVLLVVVGLIMVLKVLFPKISMALIAGIGMMAAGLYLIFKKN